MKGQLKPSSPTKYRRLQASLWVDIEKMFEMCTNYDASLRPSAQEVLWQLKAGTAKENPGKYTSLKVSQSILIEEADKRLAEAIERSKSTAVTDLAGIAPANDGTDSCTFFCLVAAQKIVNATQEEEMNDNWPELVPGIFQEIILHDLESLTLSGKSGVVILWNASPSLRGKAYFLILLNLLRKLYKGRYILTSRSCKSSARPRCNGLFKIWFPDLYVPTVHPLARSLERWLLHPWYSSHS